MAIKQVTVKALTISKINHIRACLDAGAGHHNLLFHRMEKVRPCELLPESYFDLGGIEVIQQAIHGKYF